MNQPPTPPERALPREMLAAARELVTSLAQLADLQLLGLKTPPYTRTRGLLDGLLQALRGLLHFEGSHLMLTWHEELVLNRCPLPMDPALEQAAACLHRGFRQRGIHGLVFRFLPDKEQLRYFFRRLQAMDRQAILQLGAPGQLATLPGERDLIGLQLLVGERAQEEERQASSSGLGARTAFESILQEARLDWVGHASPQSLPRGQPLEDGPRQRYCLGVYANMVSSSLRFVRMARDLHQRHTPLPFLALHRLIQQVARAYLASPGLMLACVLLGARDPSPARRLAHTVILAVGLARFHALDSSLIAEVGLTAFLYGLRERYVSFGLGSALRELEILRLLTAEQALTSLKVRSIYAAALVSMPRFWNSEVEDAPTIPTSSKLVGLAADLAATLDGTALHQTPQAPLPALVALQHLEQQLARPHTPVAYGRDELIVLARWLGPLPAGTVVTLEDRSTAVILPHPGPRLHARPLLDSQRRPVLGDSEPVSLGRRPSARRPPEMSGVKEIISARPVVDLVGRALFPEAYPLWSRIVNKPIKPGEP